MFWVLEKELALFVGPGRSQTAPKKAARSKKLIKSPLDLLDSPESSPAEVSESDKIADDESEVDDWYGHLKKTIQYMYEVKNCYFTHLALLKINSCLKQWK